ncbi:MAG: adenylyl-sulfate kinase [Campylobacterales bacterium]|nr:adenylyl-sulfate kinase [Campylobacterales bacterium]HEO98820.1 adenylyl-sulfate kinase [Campylobacterota bacterium]
MKPIAGKRILVCGKGGSGKSTIVALMADVLQKKSYQTLVLDGDASNPEGLIRLLFGLGVESEPRPLLEFFGGLGRVTCPVDDPSPLTRKDDSVPVPERKIDIAKEIPPEYTIQKNGIRMFQAGKIETYGQGCDGPVEKVVRDFIVEGEWVSLIDMKAGIEHFGRKITDTMDIILVVLDPTLESLSIAKRIERFCRESKRNTFWLILNKIDSKEMESVMMEKLGYLRSRVLGSVSYDPELVHKELSGGSLLEGDAHEEIAKIIESLERSLLEGESKKEE